MSSQTSVVQPAIFPVLSVFALAALAAGYNGGLESWSLFWVWVAALIAAAQVHWARFPATPSEAPVASRWHAGLATVSVLLYGAGLLWGTWISPLPGYSSELCLAMGLLVVGFGLARSADRVGLGSAPLWSALQTVAAVLAAITIAERLLTGERAYATLSDPNMLAGWFNACLLVSFARLATHLRTDSAGPLWKPASLLALFALGQGSTGSLSGLVCLALTLPAFALAAGWRQQRKVLVQLVLAALLVIAAAFLAGHSGQDQPGAKLQGLSQHSSFTVRIEIAQTTLRMYSENNWGGNGLSSYKWLYPLYRGPLDTGTSGDLAHNDYLQFLLEGGPLLLGALLMILATCIGVLFSTLRQGWQSGVSLTAMPQLGAAFALLALLLHAGMNFIFYSASLALTAGMLLALATPVASSNRRLTTRWPLAQSTIAAGVVSLFIATMGARGLFVGLIMDRCHLHGCNLLRLDAVFIKKLSDYLSATQPSWLLSRDYLVGQYLNGEAQARTPQKKAEWRKRAFLENLQLLNDFPKLSPSYITAAQLLERDPELAHLLPVGLPSDRVGLYQRALAPLPQSLGYRLMVGAALKDEGRSAEAFDVLFTQGMHYWHMLEWGDSGRMQLLVTTIPLAVELKKCSDALEMAQGLRVFQHLQDEAKAADKQLPESAIPTPPEQIVKAALAASDGCENIAAPAAP